MQIPALGHERGALTVDPFGPEVPGERGSCFLICPCNLEELIGIGRARDWLWRVGWFGIALQWELLMVSVALPVWLLGPFSCMLTEYVPEIVLCFQDKENDCAFCFYNGGNWAANLIYII